MKLLTLYITFQFLYLVSFSQKIQKYSGEFFNGQDVKGEASFSFFTNDKNKRIKTGSFRYSAREKKNDWHFSHNISGKYNDGYKMGKWSYTYSSKDKDVDKHGYYYNISVELDADYNNGVPQGEWLYSCYIFKFQKELKTGRYRKTNKTIVKDIKITLNWNKGKLVDSLIIIDKIGSRVQAPMNKFGVLIGDLILKTPNASTQINYDKGVETMYISSNDTINNLEYETYLTIDDKKAKVRKIKSSYLYNENCIIRDIIVDNIYNNEYFLYKYIDGDKLLTFKKEFGDYTLSLKGLYYYMLEPIPTKEESTIFSDISIAQVKTKEALWFTKKALKKTPNNKKLLADKRRATQAITEYKNLQCHIDIYKKYLNLQNIRTKARCNGLHFDEAPKTRIDYLHQIKHQSDMQYKLLSLHNQYH
ncbi:MAG: hypothetical protein KAG84_06775 [Bacteroidales bacterium]|nr:hypothetical protein [Bacteroidales bacterium]